MPEKKPGAGPVIVRKGHVKPPPDGVKIEPPIEEVIGPVPTPAEDNRPLWKRLADEKASTSKPTPVGQPATPTQGRAPRSQDRRRPGPRKDQARPHRSTSEVERSNLAPVQRAIELPPVIEATAPDEGSFADMFAGSETHPRRRFQVGEKVAGKILQIGQDVAFLELGSGLAEGMIEVAELVDAQGEMTARVGDIIDGVVIKGGDRGVTISKGRGRAHHDREALVEAARTGLPVDGLVKAANKGGIEVEVFGQRAFCPMSQIDIRFVGDPASLVGQKLRFKVQKVDARDAVLSRRALLEEERAERARQTRERLAEGAVFDGTVTSVQEYGAFVDIGGVEGLLHVSELSWDRVSRPADVLQVGATIQVQVLKIEQDAKKGERISLSLKALQPRPEPEPVAEVAQEQKAAVPAPPPRPRVGDVVTGSVDRIEPFGLFVVFPGGRGLVPAGETGTPRGTDLKRSFKVGDSITCLVSAIDERGRIRLSKSEAEAEAERKEAREYMTQARDAGKSFGTLGDLLRDRLKKP